MGKKIRIGKKWPPINYGLTIVNEARICNLTGRSVPEERTGGALRRFKQVRRNSGYFSTFIRTISIRVSLTLTISNS
jgi:hypothetical protein